MKVEGYSPLTNEWAHAVGNRLKELNDVNIKARLTKLELKSLLPRWEELGGKANEDKTEFYASLSYPEYAITDTSELEATIEEMESVNSYLENYYPNTSRFSIASRIIPSIKGNIGRTGGGETKIDIQNAEFITFDMPISIGLNNILLNDAKKLKAVSLTAKGTRIKNFHYEEGLAPCNYILPSLVTTDYFENIDLTDHSSNNSNFYPGGYGETMLLLDATAMNLEDISRLAENPTYSSDMNITIYVTNAQYIDMHRILGFSEEDEEELRKLGVTINGMLNIKAIRNKFAVHPLLAIYEDTEA